MNDEYWWERARAEGLRSTLAEAADGRDVDLIDVPPKFSPRRPDEAVLADPRGHIYVRVRDADFGIEVSAGKHLWASGGTTSLPEVIDVMERWQHGISLDELHSAFPFLRIDAYAQAVVRGTVTEFGWSQVLDPYYVFVFPLLQAAYANPRLARLYPSVSHHRQVRFGLHGRDLHADEIDIFQRSEDEYEVWASFTDERRVVSGIADAVAAAAALAPDA